METEIKMKDQGREDGLRFGTRIAHGMKTVAGAKHWIQETKSQLEWSSTWYDAGFWGGALDGFLDIVKSRFPELH